MNSPLTDTDRRHLARALELAKRGRGWVSPNPLVGAVLVRAGEALGEGWHSELGGLHAERAALEDCRQRGQDPAGATMYVSLEPCAQQGRQPPCTEAILEAGIGRVIIASEDPSEGASGRGPGILREGGVEVELAGGEEATAAALLNQAFRKHARSGTALVISKLALSLDGRTSTVPGEVPWISGERSRALVHRWRAESDAIAVGIGTVLADDPLLTARGEGQPRQPLRVVFDRRARLPLDSRLLGSLERAPVLAVVSPTADAARIGALRGAGAEVLLADAIEPALSALGDQGITSLLLEGGRTLAAAFAAADQIDEARTFLAPVLITGPEPGAKTPPHAAGGGEAGVSDAPPGGTPAAPPARAARRVPLSFSLHTVGEDALITARFKEW
ncbi:MAG TPA: bifunctional diaminohydroxyphosphoribosylaminopyrimidine deaminase/5-amino-6-(5-phosphoribosylamino)uracil reductase RibD [Solirubrobacterales bacterium]|nr:bifunctional diaminohydroxyphosphoribosylaminopyrimidine deaminase/5-amino-6-(5-phosphoribosylamino)uracil reductase RibD [Solirubrobacterales bacterium]